MDPIPVDPDARATATAGATRHQGPPSTPAVAAVAMANLLTPEARA